MRISGLFRRKPKHEAEGRSRATVVMSEIHPATPPDEALARETKEVQTEFIQTLFDLGRKHADLHNALAAETMREMHGGRP